MQKKFNLWFLLPICCLLATVVACSKSTSDPIPIPPDPVAPTPKVTFLAELPAVLPECSGVEIQPDGSFLSHNDRGNEPELYNFDSDGNLSKTFNIENIDNVDWEDLTKDRDGNLYIGDFGNNDNDRENLVIYKVQEEALAQNTIRSVEEIFFSFEDQVSFPPDNDAKLFDTEGMFIQNNFIYLFIKDRTNPFRGITRMYRLPNMPGNHLATFQGEISTANSKARGRVTSADLSPDESIMAVLSNEILWLYRDFSEGQYFSGTKTQIDLPTGFQFEGVVFQNDCTLFLTCETTSDEVASLFQVDLCN